MTKYKVPCYQFLSYDLSFTVDANSREDAYDKVYALLRSDDPSDLQAVETAIAEGSVNWDGAEPIEICSEFDIEAQDED